MVRKRTLARLALAVMMSVSIGMLVGCGGEDTVTAPGTSNELAQYDSEVVTAWFDLFLDITASERMNPPMASRAFAYEGVALYEAIVPGLGTHQSLVGQLNGLESVPQAIRGESYHWPTVTNAALADIARRLYATATPANLQLIDDLEGSFEAEFAAKTNSATVERSIARGRDVAEAIYDWAAMDGAVQYHNCSYTVPQGPGLWEPTPPTFAPPLEPCFGQLRDFVLEHPTDCAAPPPPAYDEQPGSPFYGEMEEVYQVTTHLTDEQREIALFWADGAGTITPPGHWFAILNQLTTDNAWTLDVAGESYAKLGIAVGQSFVSCWRTKFIHNLLRPITAIRDLLDDQWTPLIGTPPFPEYTSGHSVQSGAAAHVLTDMFGAMPFEDHSHDGTILDPRSFTSFVDAAEEAAISRLYGGIHFRSAIEKGVEQGTCIGEKVDALHFTR